MSETRRAIIECRHCGQRRPNGGRGLCRTCYARWWRTGRGDDIPRPHHGPHADYDEAAVQQVIDGAPGNGLTVHERRDAILRLRARGLTRALIAERLGCCIRTVERAITAARRNPEGQDAR